MIDIVDRLSFDATRCEVSFSKGVASNIEDGIAEIKRLRAERDELFNTNGELANTVAADALRLRGALQTLIDNVEGGSYESTGMALDQAKAALAVIHR